MSKLKNPRAKKVASLTRDHRKADGKNSKAARKTIPREKARTKRAHRRAVHHALEHAAPLGSDTELEIAESRLTNAAAAMKATGHKSPDVPLVEYLEGKGRRRSNRGE
jgi:hypothetical protein